MSLKKSEILEQIAQQIASLPSDYLLQPDLMTDDQLNEWHESRNTQLLIAECWRAKFITKHGDPIAEARDKKKISQHNHDLINLTVNRYKAQWEFIQQVEKYVRQGHSDPQPILNFADSQPETMSQLWHKNIHLFSSKKYPFESAYELFKKNLIEEVDGRFLWCLKDYYVVTTKKWRQATKQLSEILEEDTSDKINHQLDSIKSQKLISNLGKHNLDFSWLDITLFIGTLAAADDPLLSSKLVEYNKLLQESLKLTTTASRQLRGFKWEKGKVVYSSEKGGVYPEN